MTVALGWLWWAGCTAPVPSAVDLPPTVYLAEFADDPVARRPVTVVALVADDRDPASALTIGVEVDGVLLARPSATAEGQVATTVTVGPGPHTLRVWATDAAGGTGDDTATFTVDGAPGLTQPLVTIAPANAVTGDALEARILLDATAVDAGASADAPLTYVWSWARDGVDVDVRSATVEADRVWEGEVWSVAVYATDGTSVSNPSTARVTITNAPPSAGEVTLTPAPPTAADVLTCAASPPVDPEGDAFTSAWLWRVDDVDLGMDSDTLPAGTVRRGQTVRCGLGFVQATRASVVLSTPTVVENAAPTVAGVVITPEAPTETSGARCTPVDVSDTDGDVLGITWRWTVAGRPAGEGAALDGSAYSHGQALACEAVVSDPYGGSTTASAVPVTVVDTAPGTPVVVAATPVVLPGLVARCEVTVAAEDADGDPVSYHWYWTVDGVIIGNAPTLDTTGLVAGAVLTCTATATDGTLDGGSAEATITLTAVSSGTLDPTAAWITLTGTSPGAAFGRAVAPAGDIDGDGLVDLLVSAPHGTVDARGVVYLYGAAPLASGGSWVDADATLAWTGHAAGDGLGAGRGLAGVGDVDGDGLDDLGFGAPTAEDGAGAVYLRYGGSAEGWGADIAEAAGWTVAGSPAARLGGTLVAADLDGDGVSDLAGGAPGADTPEVGAGLVALWYGDPRLRGSATLADADVRITGSYAGDGLGGALAAANDVDEDGYADLLVGMDGSDRGALAGGAAAMISGGSVTSGGSVERLAHLLVVGTSPGLGLGREVAGPGDLDGDGVADVAIGAPLADEDVGVDVGAVYVIWGLPGMNREVAAEDADLTLVGGTVGGQLGAVLGTDPVGDLDNDGYADLITGSPTAAGGAAQVYRWGGFAPGWGLLLTGADPDDQLGAALTAGADLDGDGFREIVVGAPGVDADALDGGAVYVYQGP